MLVFSATGILLYETFPYPKFLPGSGGFLIFLALLLCLRQIVLRFNHKIPISRTLTAWLLYVWMGAGLASIYKGSEPPAEVNSFACTVMESYGLQDNGNIRCLALVNEAKRKEDWVPVHEKVILQFSDQTRDFENGERFLIAKTLDKIEKPGIPGQFDAQAFYGRQGIHYQVFVRKDQFSTALPPEPMPLRALSQKCRKFLELTLARNVPEKEDGYMLSALLLGIRRKIDPELKAAYSAAGVTHILAVSGMHVGLIFGFLVFSLGWVRRWKVGSWLFSVLIIGFLWFYALVTGLSPSVLRAVTVFSVMQLNDLLRKPPLAINGLCFATLVLLFSDPNLVFDVGYQLSFAAVYGIVSFERSIRGLWKPRFLILQKVWEGSSITLAATLSTFPVIVYYFHQFPVYFLLANVVAVPVSNALIYAGIALLITSPISFMAKAAGWVIHWTIAFLNGFVVFIQHLPFSSLEDIYMPWFCLFLLVFVLIALQLWLHFRTYVFLLSGLVIGLLAVSGLFIHNSMLWEREQNQFVIRTKKEWMLGEMEGRKAQLTLLTGKAEKQNASFEVKALKEGFHVLNVKTALDTGRIFSRDKKHTEKVSRWVLCKGRSFVFLGNYLPFQRSTSKIRIDALVIQKVGFKSVERGLEYFAPSEIWVDWNPNQERDWQTQHPQGPRLVNYRNQRFRVL